MEIDYVNEAEFTKWLRRLDVRDRVRVGLLVNALAASDVPLGMPQGRRIKPHQDLYELRSGSGHRIYYASQPPRAVILAQGNKDTQSQDIERARRRQP